MPDEEPIYDESNDFSPADPFGIPLDDDAPETGGNRPASGARQASPGEVLSDDGFQGSENAGDFLGLDVEMTSAHDATSDSSGLELSGGPGAGTTNFGTTDGLPTNVVPNTDGSYAGTDYADAADPYATPGGATATEEGYEDGYGPEGELEDGGYAEGEDFDELPGGEFVEPEPANRTKLFVGLAFGIGLVAVLGVVFAPKFLGGGGSTENVATNGGTNTTPKTGATGATGTGATTDTTPDPVLDTTPDPANGTEDPTFPGDPWTDPEATAATTEDPFAFDPVSTDPTTTTTTDPTTTPTTTDTGTGTTTTTTTPTGTVSSTDGNPAFEIPDDLMQGLENLFPQDGTQTETPEGLVFDPEFYQNLEWVSGDDLDMIWRGSEIPMEALASPAKVLMPRVGTVRVHMASNEVFEGKLYAIGQNRVWIDAQPGRLGLDGDLVTRFEHLSVDVAELGTGSTEAPMGKRVRVKTAGGVLYGRVLSTNGPLVTLKTDEGGRIVLREPVIEPIGTQRAIIVGQ